MKKQIRGLTRAEEEVMLVLWKLGNAFVKDILDYFKPPKPAYNTVSTVIRILEDKGFVDHKAFGKTHEYFPLISKTEYSRYMITDMTKGYFEGSFKSMVSFMAEKEDLSLSDIEEIKNILKRKKS